SIFYFGQFPNYFILSNLSVIALSFIVMITGVALLSISFVPILTRWISFLLTWEIKIMNHIITFIEELPGAVTRDIDYSNIQVILLYLTILLLYLAIKYKKRNFGWACYAIFALFSTTFAIRKVTLIQQNETICYNIRKEQALCFCQHQQAIYFTDSIRSEKNKSYQYSIQNHARKQHAHKIFIPIDTAKYDADNLLKRDNFIFSGGKTYYLLKGKARLYACQNPATVDVLVMGHNPTQKPEQVFQAIHFKKVIADGSNTPFYIECWKTYCQNNHIDFQEKCDL
ncbi:MAG: ComEC/Rec2 family competence protein, partial [Bacteroidales bacterium]|nr:ComEC/Rec2 family competence protein [Bacteroidales bacterium]